jgi:EAL domain-containing protein (putative c-di-GMP-specific phosphodiesterase class I)
VLTADTSTDAAHRALGLGARDFVTKPFDMVEVLLRVYNLLETRYLYAALQRQNRLLGQQLRDFQEPGRIADAERQATYQRIMQMFEDDSMAMVYQPVYDLATRNMIGCEALARFATEPVLSPDRWFASAANVGLGPRLELAAIGKALGALDTLPASMFVAVNASPGTLFDPHLIALCDEVDCSRVVIELTEHVPIEDYKAVDVAAGPLRERGVRLAVDDTGAGYAGFRHLLSIRPDVVKLDISLTRDVDIDPARRALASALVTFTEAVGATLIAEGVETKEELDVLTELNVPSAQGYHLGRPQPLASILGNCPAGATS